ncbi:MAG: rhodanese-like domain-containing protein [Cyclobacteriaceae bacterium]|nr:rhodanese-like domain-containing protein [Cyclobacteriaceae bacterium]
MRKFQFILIVVAFAACGKKSDSTQNETRTGSIISETITTGEFQKLLETTPNAVILDVRTPEEVGGGYIDGAMNIDVRASDFETRIQTLDRNSTYLVYCGSGIRSRKAADMMKKYNFVKVYDLDGGLAAWNAQGLPVQKP